MDLSKNEMFDVLILYSGGADSRLMLELAIKAGKKPYCLLIDYCQLHIGELNFAKKQLENLNIPYRIVKIQGLDINSGLTGSGEKNNTQQVHPMHVPGRNTMFIGIALSIAENMNIPIIWHGADYSDRVNMFLDCFQEYFIRINDLMLYAGPDNIQVEAPLLGMTKEFIIDLLKQFDVNIETELFSGYGGL